MNTLLKQLRERRELFPSGLFVLFFTEMWELFGRFAIMSLLVLYLTNMLKLSDSQAFSIYAGFLALIYVMSVLGGYVADRFLGLRYGVILGAVMMVIGNLLMIIPHLYVVYIGLAIVAIGSGFFTPSLIPMVGHLYQGNDRGRDIGFTLYYVGKNVGALLAPVLCGLVAVHFGYNYAFLLSALGMSLGIIVFIRGKNQLNESVIKEMSGESFLNTKVAPFKTKAAIYLGTLLMIPAVTYILMKNIDGILLSVAGIAVLALVAYLLIERTFQERRHVLVIIIMMAFVVIFQTFLNQGGASLNLFIERNIHRQLFNFTLPTSFFYSIEPVFLILLGPVIAAVWSYLNQKQREPNEVSKFGIGMLVFSVAYAVFVLAARVAMKDAQASPLFIVLGYFLFPIAELCIMPIGLSLVTKLAPKGLEAMMVGIWMLANAAGSYLTGYVSGFAQVDFDYSTIEGLQRAAGIYHHAFFYFAVVLLIAGVILLFGIRPWIKHLRHSSL